MFKDYLNSKITCPSRRQGVMIIDYYLWQFEFVQANVRLGQ